MIIVEDCCFYNTFSIIKEMALNDNRIHFFSLEKNYGPGIAFNFA